MIKTTWITCILFLLSLNSTAQQTSFKFQFGGSRPLADYTQIKSSYIYSEKIGYGFDLKMSDTSPTPIRTGSVVSAAPFFFSVSLPEGNYKVTLLIGDLKTAGEMTVKAESRRLMLEKIITQPGEFLTKTFIVNIRRPEISTGGSVKLKDRELGKLDWDNKLTLEFNGTNPRLATVEIAKADDQVTVYLAGNSTVVDQEAEPWASWGQMIPRFLKPGIAIANHAESGLTLASFKSQNRLKKIFSTIKPGDYLFIEFGHNDQKMKGGNDGAWKSYSENLRYFIRETKKLKGIPIVITSTSRRRFNEEGKTVNTLGEFPEAAKKVAGEENTPVIDLNTMTATLYDALGVEESKKAFVHYPANTFPGQKNALADNTHFNSYGAYELAKCVIEGIRQANLDLKKYILSYPPFDPAHPDLVEKFDLALTPGSEIVKPDGN